MLIHATLVYPIHTKFVNITEDKKKLSLKIILRRRKAVPNSSFLGEILTLCKERNPLKDLLMRAKMTTQNCTVQC